MSNRAPIIRIASATALALAMAASVGCASTGTSTGYYGGNSPGYGSSACDNCGTVTRITVGGSLGTTGAVIGGIVGAIAGHEISDHTGGSKGNQNVAAAAGAAAGAVAGNKIQQNVTGNSYDIQVRMDDGRVVVVNQKDLNGIRESSYVRVVNGRVIPR